MPEKPEIPEELKGAQWGLPPIEEGPKRRPTQAESTPGGVGSPLGTETYDTRPLPALDALLQTNFEGLPEVKGLTGLISHAETHMAGGYDEVHSFDTISVYDFILMRSGHETDTGVRRQDEITAPSVPNTEVPEGGSYASKDCPLIRLESDESTDPQRIRVDLVPRQGTAQDTAFLRFYSDQAAGDQHSEMGLIGWSASPSGTSGLYSLFTFARSIHSGTPHIHKVTLNPWNHALELPSHDVGFRIANVDEPVLSDDAATKNYVDSLSYAGHTLLDGSLHTDTVTQGATEGSLILANATPKWDELVISVPAANVRNVLGVDNAETAPTWKAALDATNPVNAGGAAAPGTSLIFAHRDHVHAVAANHSGSTHHAAVTLAPDAQELLNLSTQEIGFVVKAANLIFAGPAAGGAADPTFRSMVAADLVAHTGSHKHGGGDEVATATAAANAIPKAGAGGKLAAGWLQEVLAYADLTDDPYADHSARHELAGADVLSLAGLSGELADDQPPKVHGPSKHTEGTAWRLTYQDVAGDETEIVLGADGTVLTSTGANSAPAFEAADEHAHANDHAALTIGTDAAHSLAAQVLSAVLAANGQTGHMSGAMFDKLDAIEATADVTDATNVAGAGAVMDSDISPGEGFLRKTGAGTYTAHKSNLAAAAAPDADEDSADGYSVGSVWIDTTNDDIYICVDATEAAAVWLHLNAAAAAHTIASHSDTTATGAELETLTDGSDADGLHDHATLITAAEAITAVEGEATLALSGAVAITGILTVDVINEKTAGVGVSIDGLPIKDGAIDYSAALTDRFWHYTDFFGDAVANNDPLFLQVVSGAGSNWESRPAEASHRGIWRGLTGTTATGHALLRTHLDGFMFSNGRIRYGVWVRTAGTLSTGAQRYQVYAGVMNEAPVVAVTNGILMHYRDDVNGGKWQARVLNGGGITGADTGVLVAVNTWYYLEMEINAAGNSVEFFINGASVVTIASGPAANSTAEARIGIEKAVGITERGVSVDAAYIEGDLAVAR